MKTMTASTTAAMMMKHTCTLLNNVILHFYHWFILGFPLRVNVFVCVCVMCMNTIQKLVLSFHKIISYCRFYLSDTNKNSSSNSNSSRINKTKTAFNQNPLNIYYGLDLLSSDRHSNESIAFTHWFWLLIYSNYTFTLISNAAAQFCLLASLWSLNTLNFGTFILLVFD